MAASTSNTPRAETAKDNKDKPQGRRPPWYKNFGVQILLGLVAGVALGLIGRAMGSPKGGENWLVATASTIGSSYVSLLKVAVVPLVFAAVVSSIANLRHVADAAKLAVQTLIWFAITALIAVVIGIVVGLVFQPGINAGVSQAAAKAPSSVGSWSAFLTGLIPSNFLGVEATTRMVGNVPKTAMSFNVLQILVMSIAVGIAALKVGKPAEPFLRLTGSFLEVIQKILWWIIRLAPIGTAALIANAVATYGWDAIGSLGKFSIAIYVGLLIVFVVVYPAILKLHGLSIRQFASGVWPATQLGFVSRSSLGTMPLTQRVTEENLGVPRSYASFAIPLGATTKMDGCAAIYPAIAAIFVSQFFNMPLTATQYLLIVFVSVIGSAATAGTTGATVMLTLTLSTLGLPLEGVGLLLAVDPILDMGRTALNVTGQALVAAVVAKRVGILDQRLYDAPRTGEPFHDHEHADMESGSDQVAPAGV